MRTSFGKWKHNLHNHYLRYANDKERLKHIPQGLSPDGWKEMLKVFSSENFQERSLINSENRRNQKTVTSTGPKPFAQVQYEMMDEEKGELPKASDVWKATHGIEDVHGQVVFRDPESTRVYEDMQRIEAQPVNDDEPIPTPDDVMQEVLGVRSGYARGKGFGYKASTKGMACSSQKDEVNALKNEVERLTTKLTAQEEHIKEQEERIKAHEEQIKEQEERDRERMVNIMEQNKLFDSYIKRMDSMFELNSSRSTHNSVVSSI
ncbi:hypothetical protein M5689_010792 [Euphorbia peplus]|nr:hypothetical protein M5689_010792 [Euphorbia peplus]